MTDSRDGVGIVVAGADRERPFHYYVAAGIDPENRTLHFLSATGLAENEPFRDINPFSKPALFRETIIDTKFEHRTEKKQFYTTSVEDEFNRILTENLNRIGDLLKSKDPDGELERFLSNRIREFRTSELQACFVDLENLQLDDEEAEPSESEDDSPDEVFEHEIAENVTVRTIQPIIDVENGRSVNNLQKGDSIVVKSPRQSDETRTEATFLEFSKTNADGEGFMLVQLDEDVLGRGTVSRGSLIKVPEKSGEYDALEGLLKYSLYFLAVLMGVFLFLWLL